MVALFPGTVETYFTPRTKRIEFTMEKAARDLITLEAEKYRFKIQPKRSRLQKQTRKYLC